jgi:rhodanese-related sulfurtransferase
MDKDNLMDGVIPPQPPIQSQSGVHELKSRLEWGEPAFTILDVRERSAYNDSHIMGAMTMPMDVLVDMAKASIALSRDIYIYGETDEETAAAAQQLRSAGFEHIAELKGGLPAWKAIAGPTEGIIDSQAPVGGEAYNVMSQLQHHTETQKNLRE